MTLDSALSARPSTRWSITLLLLIALAALLRFHDIGRHSFWLDEFLALQNSTGRLHDRAAVPLNVWLEPAPRLTDISTGPGAAAIWSNLPGDTHPPLHFILLRFWRSLFGDSEAAVRSLSAIFSVGAIPLLFAILVRQFRPATALWACAITAVASLQIDFAQETRNYAMAQFLVLLAAWAVVRLEDARRAWPLGTIALLSSVAALLTLYLAGLPLLAIALYAAIRFRGRRRIETLAWLACGLGLFLLAWGKPMLTQVHAWDGALAFQQERWKPEIATVLRRLVTLPSKWMFRALSSDVLTTAPLALLYLLPLLLIRRQKAILLWWLMMIVTVVGILLNDVLHTPTRYALDIIRYTFLGALPAYVLIAVVLMSLVSPNIDSAGHRSERSSRRPLLAHACLLLIVISCAMSLPATYAEPRADARSLARFVTENAQPGDLIIAPRASVADWAPLVTFLAISHYGAQAEAVIFPTDPLDGALAERLEKAQQVWILSADTKLDPRWSLPGFTATGQRLTPALGLVTRLQRTTE